MAGQCDLADLYVRDAHMTQLRSERLDDSPLESFRLAPGQSPQSGLVAATTFRSVVGHSPTGVAVVTTRDDNGRHHGITVSSYASLSLEPPLVLICIDRRSRIYLALTAARTFSVNILSADQEALARRFASRVDDRFADIAASPGESGDLLIAGVLAYLECVLVDEFRGGDHSIFVGAVSRAKAREGLPLLHFRGRYTEPVGHRKVRADASDVCDDICDATSL